MSPVPYWDTALYKLSFIIIITLNVSPLIYIKDKIDPQQDDVFDIFKHLYKQSFESIAPVSFTITKVVNG